MSKLYNAAKKAFFEPAKKAITKIAQKTSGQGPTRGQTINYVKPKLTNLEGEKKKAVLKAKSDVQKKFGPVNEGVQKEVRNLRQSLQKLRKEPVTPSGISKGSNLTPGIYDSAVKKRNKRSQDLFEAAKGRKKLKFGGGADMGSKKLSPRQMEIAKLAGNKKKIDAKDLKKLRAMKSPISKSVRKS